jgi:ribosome-associated translation inhibitor RaiA/cold shock CspA family protein
MQVPTQITFRDVAHSEQIEEQVREHAAKLEEFYERITSCHVVIEKPHRHHGQGNLFHVRIHVAVPGRELVVDREPAEDHAREDVLVTIRDAFKAMRRQLEDYVRKLRGDTKTHQDPAHGRVIKVLPEEGCGFLETIHGRTLYFHRNSVLDDAFGRLEPGTEVRFAEEEGEQGPQASSVRIVGRHHHIVE